MKTIFKILLLFSLCYLLMSCGSTKNKSAAVTKTTAKEVLTTQTKEVAKVVSEHFGDTLKGVVPMPQLTSDPVNLVFESGGQRLELKMSATTLAYKSTPKHIATTTVDLKKETSSKKLSDVEVVKQEKTVKTEKPWRPPWQLIILIIVFAAVALLTIKNRLIPF